MEVNFEEAVTTLKTNIAAAINTELQKFRLATGVSPTKIDIEMIDVTIRQNHITQRVVGTVLIDLGRF